MKKLFALLLAIVMIIGTFALASCGDNNVETTPEEETSETTLYEATTTTEATTTEATTTEATTTEATTTEQTTTLPETTTLPVFARFDFGTASKAQANNLTSHEHLVSILTYNDKCVEVTYTEDSIVMKALKNAAGTGADDFALRYEDIITYDFDDELFIGWGGWEGAPWTEANVGVEGKWQGRYQYIRIRMKNNTKNNMASFTWHLPGNGYASTMVCSNLYLQGGEPTSASDAKLTATPSEEWFTVTYDYIWINGLASNKTRGAKNYFDYVKETKDAGSVAGNNMVWNTKGGKISAIKFFLLGAYSGNYASVCDTRANIVAGATVEVDYILFGATPESLDTYKSYLEEKAA